MSNSKAQLGRSVAGVVRERLPAIEQRITLGWSLRRLHQELVDEGFAHELEGFRSALRRARSYTRRATKAGVPMGEVARGTVVADTARRLSGEPDYFARKSVFGKVPG